MAYAIMQKELTPLEVDRLKRAFRAVPSLCDLDAQTSANDAYGILLKGLEVEMADTLQQALFKEGVETVVVEETDLPIIPPAKLVKQVDFLPAYLTLYDPMGRAFTLAWRDMMIIAAGNVRIQEVRKIRTSLEPPHYHGSGISYDTVSETKSREEAHFHFLLELVLAGGVGRYSIVADDFAFDSLGSVLTQSLPMNFALLVRELARYAPHAGLNRGAFQLCQDPPDFFPYPSKAAFHEELTWMLWRVGQIKGGAEI
jgi:hypothetical protein